MATAFFGGAFFGGEFFLIASVTDVESGGPSRRRKRVRPLSFAEFETKQQRIEAMARAMALNAMSLSQPIAQIEDEIEDDEAILLAAIRTVLH